MGNPETNFCSFEQVSIFIFVFIWAGDFLSYEQVSFPFIANNSKLYINETGNVPEKKVMIIEQSPTCTTFSYKNRHLWRTPDYVEPNYYTWPKVVDKDGDVGAKKAFHACKQNLGKTVTAHLSLFNGKSKSCIVDETGQVDYLQFWKVRSACAATALQSSGDLFYCNKRGKYKKYWQ